MDLITSKEELALWESLQRVVQRIEYSPRVWLAKEPSKQETEHIIGLLALLKNQDPDDLPAKEVAKLQEITLKLTALRGLAEQRTLGAIPTFMLQIDQPAAPTKFTLFGTLPKELRYKIWRCAFPEDRVVEIYPSPPIRHYGAGSRLHIRPVSQTNLSRLLRACRESRQLILERYTAIRATELSISSLGNQSLILLDPESDLIYYNGCSLNLTWAIQESPSFMKIMKCFGRIALNKIEFDRTIMHQMFLWTYSFHSTFQSVNLQEILLVRERGIDYVSRGQIRLFEDEDPMAEEIQTEQLNTTEGWHELLEKNVDRGELSEEQKEQLSGIKFTFLNRERDEIPKPLSYYIKEYMEMRSEDDTDEDDWSLED